MNKTLPERDPEIDRFYKSLGPKEKEAHTIAAQMLGSSYVIEKTKSFTKWKKEREQEKNKCS
jgi:hypothetical protein